VSVRTCLARAVVASVVCASLGACSHTTPPAIGYSVDPSYRIGCDPPCVPAPDLVGRNLGDLAAVFRRGRIPGDTLGDIAFRVSDQPFRQIIAQAPWPGERMRLAPGGLSLVVSGGPVGGSTTLDWCDDNVPGRCIKHGPTSTAVRIQPEGFRIRGEPATVPDVTGLPRRQAARRLARASFYYRVETVGGSRDVVLSQTPKADAVVHAESEVVIRVACEPATPVFPAEAYVYDACAGWFYSYGNT